MAVRQRGDAWQVDVTFQGTRAPRVSMPTKREAEALEAQFLADLKMGREPTVPQATRAARLATMQSNLALLGNLFDHTYRLHWKGTKNERHAGNNGRQWVVALGTRCDVTTLTTAAIADVCDQWSASGNSDGTINRKLAALSKMLRVAHEEEVIPRIPTLPKRKEYAGRIRYYSDEEETSLLTFFTAQAEHDLVNLIILAVETGFRYGELVGLQVRDFSKETNTLHLWDTKSDTPRSIPLTKRAREVAERCAEGKGPAVPLVPTENLGSRRISYLWERWREYHGIPDDREAVFHTLRHTCCSRLTQKNVHPFVIKDWMGHKTLDTTMRYAHLAPNRFDTGLAALEEWRT